MLDISTISSTQYSTDGSPWVLIATKDTIDLDTLQYSFDGSPWYGIMVESPAPANSTNFMFWFSM